MGVRRHVKFSSVKRRGNIKNWKGSLKGHPVFILGNGPSLNDYNIDVLGHYFTIGINRAFYKIDPTILIWQDIELWHQEKSRLTKLNAIKACRNVADPQNRFYHFKVKAGSYRTTSDPSTLYGRGSTGPLAVQLAYVIGCSPIVLLGCDCQCRDKMTDFYGVNRHHKEHTMINCLKGLKWIKSVHDKKEIKIISCSDNKVFERQDLNRVIDNIDKEYRHNRRFFNQKIFKQQED